MNVCLENFINFLVKVTKLRFEIQTGIGDAVSCPDFSQLDVSS